MTPKTVWQPQAGSQTLFLTCPVFECLYEGTRGPGKSDALLMDFAQFVGRGYGSAWTGVIFRQEYKPLRDIIKKSQKWFKQIFPDAVFIRSQGDYCWRFGTGEELLFRAIKRSEDYWDYHGHEYPWIGWEELTEWPSDELYMSMMSCCRSSTPNMPRRYRATCNPLGPGHNWVKARFIDPAPRGKIIRDAQSGRDRVCVHGEYTENKILLANDPDYIKNLMAQTGPRREAWLKGRWDIVAGGMFDDVWDEKVHVIEPFDIPNTWRITRSFDWGSSKPYSVGWWAESDGSDIVLRDKTHRSTRKGTLYRIAELYGWTGKANEGTKELATEVARKIVTAEKAMGLRVSPGPADTSIFDTENGNCIADDMARLGVRWEKADKKPGSRINGWEKLRERLKNAITKEGAGLYIFSTCRQFVRTVPVLPRAKDKPDDVDTEAEDHVADEVRYKVLAKVHKMVVENG